MSGFRIRLIRSQRWKSVVDGQGDRRLGGELGDVGAGGEGPVAGAGDHDRPAVRVAIERLERVGQLVDAARSRGR